MSDVWVIVRDDNDNCGCGCPGCGRGGEVLAVLTVDAMAEGTVAELNRLSAESGAPARFRAIRVGLNSGDKLPGQWVEETQEVQPGLHLPVWGIDGFLTQQAIALHRPEWKPWPTVFGVEP